MEEGFLFQRGDTGARVPLLLHGFCGGAPWFIRGAYTAASSAKVKGLSRQATAARGEDLIWAGHSFRGLQAKTLLLRGTSSQNQGQLIVL